MLLHSEKNTLEAKQVAEKGNLVNNFPEERAAEAEAQVILLVLIGTAEAVPFQNNGGNELFRKL
jgi:hypothetical protein